MTLARLSPGAVRGRIDAPPSKSYTHRAVVAAHLAGRRVVVRHPLVSDDTLRTARAVRTLGARLTLRPDAWTISPGPRRPDRKRRIDCGESGTTARFVTAIAARERYPVVLVGRGRLPDRPIGPLLDAVRQLGGTVEETRAPGRMPFAVRGPIHGGTVRLDPSVSSQFTSALLLVMPTLATSSRLTFTRRPVSEPYVAATVALLRQRGVVVEATRTGFFVPGRQRYRGGPIEVPGDASSAAYLWAGAAISNGDVAVRRLPAEWPQADLAVLDLLQRYGADVERTGNSVRVRGGPRRSFRFGFDGCPDLLPLAGVLAASAPGRSVLSGAEHAAAKESDRRLETARLARAMGATVRLERARMEIRGSLTTRPIRSTRLSDHRLVMSAAVAALAADGPSTIGDAAAVAKSFPEFFARWSELGAEVELA